MSPYDPARHGPKRIVGPGFHEQVFALVRQVPAGALTTYGDVGAALGSKNVARQVGYAMAALPADSDVPWWRVVSAGGRLSQRPEATERQAILLADDGVDVRDGRAHQFAARRHVFTQPEVD